MGLILIVLLLILILGGIPPLALHPYGWNVSGGLGLALVIVLILVLLGRI